MNLLDRAIQMFRLRKSWLGDKGEPVPNEQAQRRADVCLKCPNNQEKPIYEIFAVPMARAVLKQLKLKDEMKLRVRQEECLHVCSVCLCILKLKVHVPLKYILESGIPDGLPPFCWQLTEQTQNSHDPKDSGVQKQ